MTNRELKKYNTDLREENERLQRWGRRMQIERDAFAEVIVRDELTIEGQRATIRDLRAQLREERDPDAL